VIDLYRRFVPPYRWTVVLIMVLLMLQSLAQLYLPELNAEIINEGVVKGDVATIVRLGAEMLGVSLLYGGVAVVSVYFSARTAMAIGRDIRGATFTSVQSFSLQEVHRFGAPSLITRTTNDVQQVQMMTVMAMTIMITAPMMLFGGVFMAIRQDVVLSLLLVLIVPVMAIVLGLLMARAIPLFRVMQYKIDEVNRVLREQLTGIRVIRAFVRSSDEEARFAVANADLTGTTLRVNQLMALMLPALLFIMNASSVAVVWFGGHRIADGEMPVGNLLAFLTYLTQILFSVMMAVMVLAMVPRAAAASERIMAVLTTTSEISDPEEALTPEHPEGIVTFDRVTFGYPGASEPVLYEVSFTARPGQTTAIVGSTGSGKSTLVHLIPRLYDVTSGSVAVDGVDVRRWQRSALWSVIGFVPQKAFLFSGTVAENLRFGATSATDEAVWQALRIAQSEPFVAAAEEGLAMPVEQGGGNLSGGQRQRLAIARAVAKQPRIYVFDDSFSALDYATDAALRRALAAQTREATVIVVAQRVSTILHADQIVVLDRGRVVGVGTHHELLATCPTYAEIVSSQLQPEEIG
jgi:ATP-binding cassette subfamily B multidrug efflux pump